MGSEQGLFHAAALLPDDGIDDLSVLPFDVASAKRRHTPIERHVLRSRSLLLPEGTVHDPEPPRRQNPRLAIYLRISQQVDDSVSIRRQLDECVREVTRLGGQFDPERDVFHDVDVSASKGLYRAGMEELLLRIRDERCYDGVVVWELPRALRSQIEATNLRRIFMQGSCDLYIVSMRELSLWGASSIFFDYNVQLAERESRTTGERQKSRHRLLSPYGAARHAAVFGMKAAVSDRRIDGMVAPLRHFVPDDAARDELGGLSRAALVRELIDEVLAGRSLSSLAAEWTKVRGFRAPRGGPWSGVGMKQMLQSPTLGGLAHRGYRLLGADGEELDAASGEAPLRAGVGLVDAEKWLRLQTVLAGRSKAGRTVRESPLGGLVWCGRCGQRMNRRGSVYMCQDVRLGSPTCGSINSMTARLLEEWVEESVLERLRSRELRGGAWALNKREARPVTERLESEIEELHRALGRIEELWLSTTVVDDDARERHARRRLAVERQLSDRQRELSRLSTPAGGEQVSAMYRDDGAVEQVFRSRSPHVRLSVLMEMIDRVVVHPRSGTSKAFDPDRIVIAWARAWGAPSPAGGLHG